MFRTIALLTLCSLAVGQVFAQGVGSHIFNARKDKSLGNAGPALNEYLNAQPPSQQAKHHFCVVGYDNGNNAKLAYVYWREGQKLILWEGSRFPEYAAQSLILSRRQLDLTQDVVATEADIAGSTYLVTKAWVAGVATDCAKQGTKYVLHRPRNKG